LLNNVRPTRLPKKLSALVKDCLVTGPTSEDFLKQREVDPMAGHGVEEQIGRKLDSNDTITIYEFKIVYEWQLEKS
jgi:hypothetical protein